MHPLFLALALLAADPASTPSPSPSPVTTATPASSPAPKPEPSVVLPKSPELETEATPTPAPAATATPTATPSPAPTGPLARHVTQWPVQLTASWIQGLAPRTQRPALLAHAAHSDEAVLVAADYSPIRGLAVQGGVAIDNARTLLVPAGGAGCGPYTFSSTGQNCSQFNDDVFYVTQSTIASLGVKPYLTLGSFRVSAAAMLDYASVDYMYTRDPAFTDQSYGKGTSVRLGVSGAVGVDWAYKLAPNGACFIVTGGLGFGGPHYGENLPQLFYPNHTWSSSDVGTALNPFRLTLGAGFSFPTAHPPGG